MAKYAVIIRYKSIEVTGPHAEVRLNDARVRATYRVGQDTYHVVRVNDRHVRDDVISNLVINHAQSLGFRGADVVRIKPERTKRATPASDRQLGLFDIGEDNKNA